MQNFNKERINQPEMAGGPGSSYEPYFDLKDRIAHPVYRQIYDAFRYADLTDPKRRNLVERLADMGDQDLTAHCNQYTLSVISLLRERSAILSTLDKHEMPPGIEDWKRPPEDLDIPWTFDFDEAASQMGDIIWSVPLTPRQCYERLDDILQEVNRWHQQRAEAETGGYFYDTWPLLQHFARKPEEREHEDITGLLPFFYREAYRYCATTAESMMGHIQAVNANAILQYFGGLSLRPEQLRQAGLLPEPGAQPRR